MKPSYTFIFMLVCTCLLHTKAQKFEGLAPTPPMGWNSWNTFGVDILTNKEAIAINQDPLGKQGYRFMDHRGKEIWVKELAGGNWAICFFNDGDENLSLRINWDHFYILDGEYQVRDIWKKTDLGTTRTNMEFEVAFTMFYW